MTRTAPGAEPRALGVPLWADLRLHYQPQIDLRSGEVVGAEALIRWSHPDRGLLTPAAFLPDLIEAGLLTELTRWVVRQASAQQALWAAGGLMLPVSVNVPASMLGDAAWRADLIEHGRTDGRAMTLEVLEGERLPDVPQEALQQLVAAGYRLSVDDIGTGFASLERLATLPVTEVKLDTSLVIQSATSVRHRALVAGLARLAGSLGLRVVAEGVESEQLRSLLLECDVTVGQGWLFAAALDPDDFTAYATAAQTSQPRRRSTDVEAPVPQHSVPARGGLRSQLSSVPSIAWWIATLNLVAYLTWKLTGFGGAANEDLIGDFIFCPINALAAGATLCAASEQ